MFLSCEKNSKSEDEYESLKIKSCFFSSGLKLASQSAGIGLQVRSRPLNEHNAAQWTWLPTSMEKGLLKVTFWRYLLPGNYTEKISEGAVLWEFPKVLSWVDYASIIVPNWCVNVWCIVCF